MICVTIVPIFLCMICVTIVPILFVYDLCDNRAGFFVYDLCDNRTEEGYPYIKANNVASPRIHPSYDIFYLVLFWYAAWLHTAWSCGY